MDKCYCITRGLLHDLFKIDIKQNNFPKLVNMFVIERDCFVRYFFKSVLAFMRWAGRLLLTISNYKVIEEPCSRLYAREIIFNVLDDIRVISKYRAYFVE